MNHTAKPRKTAANHAPTVSKTMGVTVAKQQSTDDTTMNTTDLSAVDDFDGHQFMTELKETTQWLADQRNEVEDE